MTSFVEEVQPGFLISPKRMDIMCKYRLFKEIKNGFVLPETAQLYTKHILLRTGGIEPTDIFGKNQNKNNISDYISSAVELIKSLKENRFKKDFPIPYYNNKQLGNGAHRLAASLALDIPVFAQEINTENRPPLWDFSWFTEKGFSLKEQLVLLYEYAFLKTADSTIFVFYSPAEKHWDDFEKIICESYDIAGSVNLSIPNKFCMYELIQDIYGNLDSFDSNNPINRKALILAEAPLKVRVILAEKKQELADKITGDLATEIKDRCRDIADKTVSKKTYLSLHASASEQETKDMAEIFFSYNNLSHLASRKTLPIRQEFLKWIAYCRKTCAENGIDTNDICIVGSSPLEVIGVRQSTDIDFTVADKYRKDRFGDGITHLNENNDIVTKGYHRLRQGRAFTDDEMIAYPDLHFYFRGLKFANPKIILERKDFSRRDKDVRDLLLYNEYKNKPFTDMPPGADYITAYETELKIRGII